MNSVTKRHPYQAKSVVPWVWTGLVGIMSIAVVAWTNAFLGGFIEAASTIGPLLLSVLFTGLAALIAIRQPGNQISWLMYLIGFGLLLEAGVAPLLEVQPASPSSLDYLAIFVSTTVWQLFVFPLVLLFFLFPTGRFLSSRWAWALWLAGLMALTDSFFNLFTAEIGPLAGEWLIPNPIGFIPISAFDDGPFEVGVTLALLTLGLGGPVALGVRYRRSALVTRTQIKWVLYGAVVFALAFAFVVVSQGWKSDSNLVGLLLGGSIGLIPISITIAITRYRLFEIDRIISRSLSYTLVVALLGTLYFAMVTLISAALPTQNSLAVSASALATAVLFNPLRKRIQYAVDRRFNRSGYQAEVIGTRFAAELQESLTVDQLAELWTQTVVGILQPEATGIWLKQTDS